jgi:hypothetical protein
MSPARRLLPSLLAVSLLAGCATKDPDMRLPFESPIVVADRFPPPSTNLFQGTRGILILLPSGLPPADARVLQNALVSQLSKPGQYRVEGKETAPGSLSREALSAYLNTAGLQHVAWVEVLEYRDFPPYRLIARLAIWNTETDLVDYEVLAPFDTRQQADVLAARKYAQQSVDRSILGPAGSAAILERKDLFLEFVAERLASGFWKDTGTVRR